MPVVDGDVVIRQSGAQGFTLETYPEHPQVLVQSYRAAVQLARGFAEKTKVVIWFENSKGRFTKVKASKSS